MANIKVSEMPTATSINNEDYLMVVQGNENKKITYEKLNNKINMIGSFAKAIMDSDYTVVQDNTIEVVPLTTFYEKSGNFTINNDGIRIGSGISKIIVSGSIYFYTGVSGKEAISYIYKNNTQVSSINTKKSDNYETSTFPMIPITVSEGDIIKIAVNVQNGGAGAVIKNYQQGTFLTVIAIG